MKDNKQTILLIIVIVLAAWNIFTTNGIKTDVKAYKEKIESIQTEVDSAQVVNKEIDTKVSEVKENVLKNIWKFLGLGFLITLATLFGMVFCYLPGVYLLTVLSLATSIMVFEEKSIGDTFSHSFTLVKGEWWNTFGVLIVVWMLLMILGQVFSIPALIYQFVKMGTVMGTEDPTEIFSIFKDPIYLLLNIGSYIFQFILYSIPLISTVFVYFDLNEQKHFTGTFEKIDNLGNTNYEA